MTIEELRSYFPHTGRIIYLNHAATAPLSLPVMEAVGAYLEERHVTSIDNYVGFAPVLDETLARIARVIGTTADRVEFAPNTSYALNVLAQGLDWSHGDRVAVPSCEFPANVYPFLNLERLGVEVDFVPHVDGTVSIESIERALTPRTRLLTISWVQFLSGFRADLAAIGALCRERGVIFCVDAIQGLGALRLDVNECGIDFLACGGHKWLMATQGIGFLYVTRELQDRLRPAAGWLHGPVDWEDLCDYRLDFHETARRYRLGTMNSVGVAALNASLALYERAGPRWCEEQVLALSRRLAAGVEGLGLVRYGQADACHDSGIVAFDHPQIHALEEFLRRRAIEGAVRQMKLRFAPTYYNSPEEIDAVVGAVAAFDEGRPT